MSLVAVLKKAGIPAQIIDEGLGDEAPDGDIFLTSTTANWEEALKFQRYAYTVIGGPHATLNSDWIFQKMLFSCCVVGEGEEMIVDIVKHRPRGLRIASRIIDLDKLPFPDRTDAHRYNWSIEGKKATSMVTSRGCTGKCAFCCRTLDRKIYFRSAANVIEEVRQIRQDGFEAVMFYDDSIAMKKDRLKEICAGLSKLDIIWRCFVRSDQVDREVFQMMAQGGCREVLVGVESGSNQILKNIHKDETADTHFRAIVNAQLAGIKVKALMIAGLPGETWETIEESKQFIEIARPDSLDVTVLQVYKGCPIFNNPANYDLSFKDPSWYKGRTGEYFSTVRTSAMSEEEIVTARDYLWQTFNEM
jgi:anaerobic magnesium-protoporphyrin IX monomethyl ester cyclase